MKRFTKKEGDLANRLRGSLNRGRNEGNKERPISHLPERAEKAGKRKTHDLRPFLKEIQRCNGNLGVQCSPNREFVAQKIKVEKKDPTCEDISSCFQNILSHRYTPSSIRRILSCSYEGLQIITQLLSSFPRTKYVGGGGEGHMFEQN